MASVVGGGASLQSRQSTLKVLTKQCFFPSFSIPDYLLIEYSIKAAALALGLVCSQTTLCRNLDAVRPLIYKDTIAIRRREDKNSLQLTAAEDWSSNTGCVERYLTLPT